MLLQLICCALARKVIIGGNTYSYDWEYAPLTPFEVDVSIEEEKYNSAVFLYSDQQFQRVRINVTISESSSVNVALFQFQMVPLTLHDSDVTFHAESKLKGLSLIGDFDSDTALTVADSNVTYDIQSDIECLFGLGNTVPELTVKSSQINISCNESASLSTVAGLAK